MKRLVWFFLAVFCTAIAQIQPVDLPLTATNTCSCCATPAACGMPDCSQPPGHAPAAFASEKPARVARFAVRHEVRRIRRPGEKFYLGFVSAPITPAVLSPVSALITSPPTVPLFKAHCGFLV